ncbi:MAG: GNAT family N-acetyltransferase [Chloroflexota bacterium]
MVTSRAYSGAADLQRLIDFLSAERQRNPMQRWHIGDLIWRMFYSSKFDPVANVRLWEENGAVIGFGWLYPPSGADLFPRDLSLLAEMIEWAQGHSQEGEFYAVALDSNHVESAYYEAQGFQPKPPYGYQLLVSLTERFPLSIQSSTEHVPFAKLPEGFTIRPLAGVQEAEARAEAHRLAFGTQNVTDEGYRNLVSYAPIYDRELDLLVIAPDGRIAAFCLCWLDAVNRVGLVEPVGTHPDFRRLGLARAIMTEGLRRMRARGMETALIAASTDNNAAKTLYQSLGFEIENSERIYLRP